MPPCRATTTPPRSSGSTRATSARSNSLSKTASCWRPPCPNSATWRGRCSSCSTSSAARQAEIAERLGISGNYVSHILRASLAKLRKILAAEEEQDRLLRRQAEALDYDQIDPTTGAYTQAYLKHRLEEEAHRASAEGGSVALVRVAFDGLDEMRKFYGEAAVRDFLIDAADFLKKNVRRLDMVARDGDTGFAIMLPFTGGTVEAVRERLTNAAAGFTPGRMGPRGGLVVRMGTASLPEAGRWAKNLYAAAEPK